MHAFDVLGDPVRRRILELLAGGEHSSGVMVAVVQAEFGITQSAVSQHLKVLREARLLTSAPAGNRHIYQVDPAGVAALRDYLDGFWNRSLAAFKRAAEDGQEEQER